MTENSDAEMTGNAQMPAHHVDEGGIALGGPDRGRVTDDPEQETRDPEPQTKTKGGRERAVDDRDRPRRAAHQDRLGQRAMHGRDKASDRLVHQITDPAAEREERQKEARCGEGDRQAEHDLDQPARIHRRSRRTRA